MTCSQVEGEKQVLGSRGARELGRRGEEAGSKGGGEKQEGKRKEEREKGEHQWEGSYPQGMHRYAPVIPRLHAAAV